MLTLVAYSGTFEESQKDLHIIGQHLNRDHQSSHYDFQNFNLSEKVCPHLKSLALWVKQHCEIRESDECQPLLPEFSRIVLLFKEYSKNLSIAKRDWERPLLILSERLSSSSEIRVHPLKVFQVWESTEWCLSQSPVSLNEENEKNSKERNQLISGHDDLMPGNVGFAFEREGLIIEPIDSEEDEMLNPNSKGGKGAIQRIKDFFIEKKNLAKERKVFNLFNDVESSLLKGISDENAWLESFDQGKLRQFIFHQHHWVDRCREMGALGVIKYLLKDPFEIHHARLDRLSQELKIMEEFRQWVEIRTVPVVEESLAGLGPHTLMDVLKNRDFDRISAAISTFLSK